MENEMELKGKFSNIYIMLLFGIMTNDLSNADHFLSDEIMEKYNKIIEINLKNNETQMYDEMNVKSIDIISKEELEDCYLVKARLISRYMDYLIDSTTKKYKSGINTYRVEKENILTFKKLKSARERASVIKCKFCGANMDINHSGKCEYCGSIADVTEYDYVLIDIVTK